MGSQAVRSATRPRVALPPSPTVAGRLERLREQLSRRKLDAWLLIPRTDQIWLTGFTGEDGLALVTPRHTLLLTDSRFDESADREAPWARKVLRKKRGPEATAKEIKRLKLQRVGFDPRQMDVFTFSALRKLVAPARLVPVDGLVRELRVCKDATEVSAVRKAIDVAQRAYLDLLESLRPGMTERQVAAQLEFLLQQRGAQGSAFGPIVAAGPNASLPHYEPGDTIIKDGDALLLDWGARVGGYVSDLTRMVWVGSIAPRFKEIFDVVREAHDRAIDAVRPGVKAGAVDAVARATITKAGYGRQFGHALGHGIGLDVHESPRVGNKSAEVLQPGMIVTIEPGIYLPGVGGVRLEDDVLVTESGHETLSDLPLSHRCA